MKIVVADDEPLARARLTALLRECEDAEPVASVGDGEAVLAACAAHRPHLLLLDINMPGLDGTVLAQRLSCQPDPPLVIFCTAYPQFAAQAFELGVVDYLLKPVRLERLREALARAQRQRSATEPVATPALTVRLRDEQRRIPLADVICLVADDKYVAVHHAGGQDLIEDSLRQLEQAWPGHLLRVHRNCLIAIAHLVGIRTRDDGSTVVRLAGTDFTPEVSRRNLPALRRHLRAV